MTQPRISELATQYATQIYESLYPRWNYSGGYIFAIECDLSFNSMTASRGQAATGGIALEILQRLLTLICWGISEAIGSLLFSLYKVSNDFDLGTLSTSVLPSCSQYH